MLLILLLALSALAVAATAPPDRLPAAPGWVADRWGTEQGLPSESVYRLAWAPDGRLALGTTMGLGFFDGRSFEFLRVGDPDPPPDDRAMFVLNDAEGGLWVVSESGGLQRRTQAGTTRFQDVPVAPMALHPFVWRGRVFLQGGDALIELGPEPVVNDDFPPGTSMIIARDGVDWLWCTQGPRRWSADSGGWEPVEDASEVPTLWADRDLAGFHQALDGVWLGDDRLLATDEEPAALLVDGSTVWVATRGQGLVRLRPTPITLHPSAHPTLPRADVAIPIGPEGPVWSGAAQGPGFWSVEHPEVRHRRYTFVDPLHAVSEEVVERGHLRLVPIHPPHGGRIWTSSAGTFRETPDSDADTLVLERIPEAPNCVGSPDALLYLDDGRVLLGQGAVTDGRTWTVSPQACQPLLKWPRSVVSLPTGGFLVGGLQGVGRLSPSLELTPVGGPDDLSVRHLRIWDGRIWASTDERGVCVLPLGQLGEAEPAWRCVGRLGGFPENTVHASVHDDLGRVWFSTNTGLWVARSVAVGGGAVLSARRSAATASDYASFFEGTVEPITLARRLELSVRAGPAVLEAWLAPSALLLTPFVVWAAWKKRRESWVRAAVAYGLVGPPVVVLLAPVLATHGTLERTSPALLVPTVALGVLGLASANRWLVRVRSFPRWVLPGSIGAAWAFLSFALGTDHLARQPVVALDCAALQAAAGDGPLFSAHPLRVEQRCGVPGVLLTGRLPPERAAELADRYDVRAAYLPAATDVGSLTPENAAQVLIGWTPDGDIWRVQNLKPMATSPM